MPTTRARSAATSSRRGAAADDRNAIAALVFAYAERIDAGELEAVAVLFKQATFRSNRRPEIRRGEREVMAVFADTVALYDGKPCTQHVVTNLVIELDATKKSARARSKFSVLQARPELPLQIILTGRYHDRFARTANGWRFADRLILIDLIGDLRFHLKRDPFDTST